MESFYVTSKLEDVGYSSAVFLLKPRSHFGLTDQRINKLAELCCVLLASCICLDYIARNGTRTYISFMLISVEIVVVY